MTFYPFECIIALRMAIPFLKYDYDPMTFIEKRDYECDFPLWVGRERSMTSNKIMECIYHAWCNECEQELSIIFSGLFVFGLPKSNSTFSILSTVSHPLLDYVPRETVASIPCQLMAFKFFPKNGGRIISSPLIVRLKIMGSQFDPIPQRFINEGFFYITGDAEMDDNHITDFRIEHLCYLDKNNSLNQGQILL